MGHLWQDLRYAARTLRQNWSLSAIAVISLALGIGANTAIFSLINAVLLRSLPVGDPETLVMLTDPSSSGMSIGTQGGERTLLSYPEFLRIRDRNQVFQTVFATESEFERLDAAIGDGREAGKTKESIKAKLVSGGYFSGFGLSPVIGRFFSPDDDHAFDACPYAVISYQYWKSRFALDPGALGKTIKVYRTMFTIVGVAPQGFFGETVGQAPDIWLPLAMQRAAMPGRDYLVQKAGAVEKVMWLHALARLKPGVSEKQAQASISVLFRQIVNEDAVATQDPKELKDQHVVLRSGARGASPLRDQFSEPLLVLLALVGLVLLIACANVANLLLARGMARQKEIGVRLALGASRRRLVRQLITESMVLAVLGGVLGVIFATWADRILLVMVASGPNPVPLDVTPDARLLLFTAAVSIFTGLLFGLAPALRSTKLDLNPVLKDTSRGLSGGGSSRRRLPLGKILVGLQVALSLMLLVGAGLFVRSLGNLASVKLGYDPDHLLMVEVDPTPSGYQGTAVTRLYEEVLRRIRAIPGVRSASLSGNGLFSGSESGDRISVEGYESKERRDLSARFDQVGPDYFKTIGIPVLLGREFGPQDSGNAPHVCVINETMSKFYFGDKNPIGKHIRDEFPDTRITFEIVGVVKDAKYNNVREKTPRRFYVPFFNGMGNPTFGRIHVRTFANPTAVAGMVRKQIQDVDNTLDISPSQTMTDLVDQSITQDRLIARLSSFFGGLALLLASIGLYGVMSFTTARRTSEIGLRMALGAGRAGVMWMVVRESMVMVIVGIVVGIPAALAAGRIVSSRLFGLSAGDPMTIALAAVVLAVIALGAALIPAIRASRVDPLIALRYE